MPQACSGTVISNLEHGPEPIRASYGIHEAPHLAASNDTCVLRALRVATQECDIDRHSGITNDAMNDKGRVPDNEAIR